MVGAVVEAPREASEAVRTQRGPVVGSCQAKRSTVFAAWVAKDVLLDVAHRHVVFTIPKALRGLIARERRLHGLMARTAWSVLRRLLAEGACEPDGVAGAVLSLQTVTVHGDSAPRGQSGG